MQNPKLIGRFKPLGFGILLLLLVACQPQRSTDEQPGADSVAVESSAASQQDEQTPVDVTDGFDGDVEPTEQAADQRLAGVSSDVADLLERMESCYSLQNDAKSGAISPNEALELQDQLGCDEIEIDIARTLQQHPDQPKVAQLIQQMKATFKH